MNTYCPHTMNNRGCENFDSNSHLPNVCLHLRFGEYCTWVDLKEFTNRLREGVNANVPN